MMRRVLSVLLCLCLTVGLLLTLTAVTERKASKVKYQEFFDQKEDFDVLFLGTSHVIDAVLPLELWKNYGIVSYNFGGHSNRMATTYWVMENALDYTTPKLVVIDGFPCSHDRKTSENWSYVHLSMDAFPLSVTKLRTAFDLADEEGREVPRTEGSEKPSAMSLLWDFFTYHSRWNELTQEDFEIRRGTTRGAENMDQLAVPAATAPTDASYTDGGLGVEYLEKMIEDCQKRGIEVLLTYLPFPAGETEWMESNTVAEIAERYHVPYINFLKESVTDFDTDCADANSHLNPLGAQKVTEYLGEYIQEHFQIPDHRTEECFSDWDAAYESFAENKGHRIWNQQDLSVFLMLLSTERNDLIVELGGTGLLENPVQRKLFAALGADPEQITPETDFLVIRDGGSVNYVEGLLPDGGTAETELGTLSTFPWTDEDGTARIAVLLDGVPCYDIPAEQTNGMTAAFLALGADGAPQQYARFLGDARLP